MNIENSGKDYSTKDMASMVGVSETTVRKYSQELESAGYPFNKNENGFRKFKERDLFTFNEIRKLSIATSMPVKQLAEMIVFKQMARHDSISDAINKTPSNQDKSSEIESLENRFNNLMKKLDKLDMLDDIAQQLEKQEQFNQVLLKRLDEQQDLIESQTKIRDRQVTEETKELLETRKQHYELEQARQETATALKKHKNRWFKKD